VSEDPRKKGQDPGRSEGWESLAEDEGPHLPPNEELEAALREAAAAVGDGRTAPPQRAGTAPGREDDPAPAAASAGGGGPVEDETKGEEVAALEDRLLRLQADFDNLRRRTLKEKEEAFRYGHENLVKDLLPAVDNLERAVDHARQGGAGESEGLLQGVELVLREVQGAFATHGVSVIDAEGKPFDPSVHEAMAQAPDDSVPANTVVQVFQRGYLLWDRLLRPARVVVSKPSEGGAQGERGPAGDG